MIRNIVFDMGDVLLNYQPRITCQRLAGSPQDAEIIYQTMFLAPEWEQKLDAGLFPEAEMLAVAQSRLSTQAQRDAAALIYAQYHLDSLTPKQGMDRVVEALHSRGFRLYVLSNAGARITAYQNRIPRADLFDGFLFSYEEKLIKPDVRLYQRLCQRFHLEPEECLFIDDRPANVDGARTAGMEAYCFDHGDVEVLGAMLEGLEGP